MVKIHKGQPMLKRCNWEETPIQFIPSWPFIIPSCCLPCKSSARLDKQLDRTLLLICCMKSGLSSSLNVCTIGGKAWRKKNKQKYVGGRITSFITDKKKPQTARGQACFTFGKVLVTYHPFQSK